MRTTQRVLLIGALTVTLAVSACSTKSGGSGRSSDSSGVKTDIGVTAKEITLGALTDTSGAFKIGGIAATNGNQLWANDVNAKGGVCGRQVKLDVADTGYDVNKAVTLYANMKTQDAGIIQLLGSPALAALKSQITADSMVSATAGWASSNLDSDAVLMIGSSYDVEMINGLAYLQKQGKLKDGDKIGAVFLDNEAGNNSLLGMKYYASKHGQTVIEDKVTSADADMSAVITDLKSKGANVMALATSPVQTASAATQNQAQGLNIQMVGFSPSFAPTLMNTPAAAALTANFLRVSPILPFNADNKLTQDIAKKFEAKFTDPANDTVGAGYAAGMVFEAILKKACDNKDMTRAGILKAKTSITVDLQGLVAEQDFTKPGQPGSRATTIDKPDATVKGGLASQEGFVASADAKSYKTPFQK